MKDWRARKSLQSYTGDARVNRRKHFHRSFRQRVRAGITNEEISRAEDRIAEGKFRPLLPQLRDGNQAGWLEFDNASFVVVVHIPTSTVVSLLLPSFVFNLAGVPYSYWSLTHRKAMSSVGVGPERNRRAEEDGSGTHRLIEGRLKIDHVQTPTTTSSA